MHQQRVFEEMANQAAKILPQKQQIEVFEKSVKAATAFHDGEGYSKSFYKGSIAAPKDMNALKATSAGIHKDSGFSVKQLKEELLAHSFKVGHRKEQDHFDTAN